MLRRPNLVFSCAAALAAHACIEPPPTTAPDAGAASIHAADDTPRNTCADAGPIPPDGVGVTCSFPLMVFFCTSLEDEARALAFLEEQGLRCTEEEGDVVLCEPRDQDACAREIVENAALLRDAGVPNDAECIATERACCFGSALG